jgi:hypothetical protein
LPGQYSPALPLVRQAIRFTAQEAYRQGNPAAAHTMTLGFKNSLVALATIAGIALLLSTSAGLW